MGQEMTDPADIRQDAERFSLRCSLLVPGSPEHAFAVFTDELTDWWVTEYTWSGPEALAELGMEPRAGGMLYEIGPYGFRADWGRVLTWDPPRRLVFAWQIGPDRVPVPDPARASEVEVLFLPEGAERTRVELEHRHFDRHGEAAEGYRKALTAGWHELLSRYLATVSRRRPDASA
ncbi:SRPBCC family protein [Micromonospora sp. STR1_7]|uniref:SRPBCC family protein n=1 Tax=Micromonospora parastrephiae TaxID=2806101 RepID=A0ABS1XQX2_9ACTN|nr:SRPBCC family protein [Micromonospora parastrephiae]MBM0231643.1 SRPBCC family protein [Micromonospora parastrephiae]